MNDVFKDLCTSMKGEKSVFNFLSDEDIKNLSAFFGGKKRTLAIITQENLDKLIDTNPIVGAKLLKGMLLAGIRSFEKVL